MKMTVEEFYQAIRYVDVVSERNDPVDFKDAEEQLDDQAFGLSNNKMNEETRFYLKRFINYKEKGLIISRNIQFIFFGGIWLAYRRIYWFIPILAVLQSIFNIILIISGYVTFEDQLLTLNMLLLSSIMPNLIISPFINYIYFWNTQRRLKKGCRSQADTILTSIGINWIFIIFIFIITVILLISAIIAVGALLELGGLSKSLPE